MHKPAKDLLWRKFDEWYSQQVIQQLHGKSDEELHNFDIPPIDPSMARMKEISAEWIVAMADYICENPLQFLVNGFIKLGITGALDGAKEEDDKDVTTNEDM